MKKRLLSFTLAFIMLFFAGCNIDGKKETKLKTEDLDEATLEGMAEDITDEMSLKNKIGQLFMVSLYSLDQADSKNQTKITSEMKETLKKYPVGGVVLFSKNMKTAKQTRQLISDLQDASYVPLFVAVDEEGGEVSRVASNDKMNVTHYPSARKIGETYDDQQIEDMGKNQSKELKALGFNMNFAPVADVLTNADNIEIGDRSFGSDAGKVADIISTLVKSMQKQQISATLKHFPGSGDTNGDTHTGSIKTEQSIQELRKTDFLPFQAGIKAKTDAIMVSHLMLANVTDEEEPSSLSKRVVTDILRKELEYDGMIITDAMNMKSITDNYSAGEAAVKAIQAGNDIVVMPENLKKAYKAVKIALRNGTIKESQIDDSVERIIYTKLKRGEIPPDTDLLKSNS
ncbi:MULTISPECIES: glycoside hydrolase family 3 protein [Anaerostipes]|uniref:glycoside hydrolase family 3 protein n=1 Tax=Anaerostipes TaxID=207244 RepID=UPI000952CDC0|nr:MULTISPECIES: glycoside hydrolase family 3 N-terminal domain-containing protein [Anaerostipes]MDY2726755.1 glycoside hydrolase family 3 N-terminal domain-containing protein [Anaerostipes faecalis]OLR59217.1 glycosyl hydrolase family 3 [Anaerostipes sp. 494a]